MADESLKSNAPCVLIRGCNDVQLTATTTPAGEAVTWSIAPNNNKESAPALTPSGDGRKATLGTGKAGSFSVTATLDGTKVVWNVVFAWVKVDPASSVVTVRSANYVDNGSDANDTTFISGTGLPGSHAWEAKVKMEVFGGDTDQKLGVGKVTSTSSRTG